MLNSLNKMIDFNGTQFNLVYHFRPMGLWTGPFWFRRALHSPLMEKNVRF